MKKLQFTKEVKAPADVVYKTMLGLENIKTYEQWTAEFNPTSTYEGSWEKGSGIRFVGTDKDGKKGGMVSEIEENIPNKFVSIRHLGILEGDKEITEGPEVEKWAGGHENYSFEEDNGITTIKVEMDSIEDYDDYFKSIWPKALERVREMVEN